MPSKPAAGGVPRPAPPSGAALLSGDQPLVIGAPAQGLQPSPVPPALTPAALGAADAPASRAALPSAPAASPAVVSPIGTPPQSGIVSAPSLSAPAPASAPASGDRPAAASGPAPAAPALIPAGRELVLDRRRRRLEVRDNGITVRRFAVAVGMPGWETPVGRFAVLEKTLNPIWEHPQSGVQTPPGAANPLGSRWIGFHRDCSGRRGWDGESMLDVKGCVVAGFHGTPHRWTVGQAVSHGCVRLYDEDVRTLYEMVSLGMRLTVLP